MQQRCTAIPLGDGHLQWHATVRTLISWMMMAHQIWLMSLATKVRIMTTNKRERTQHVHLPIGVTRRISPTTTTSRITPSTAPKENQPSQMRTQMSIRPQLHLAWYVPNYNGATRTTHQSNIAKTIAPMVPVLMTQPNNTTMFLSWSLVRECPP